MQFLLYGQKHAIPTIIMVIVYWKSAIQEKTICLAYNSSGLWNREVSALEGQTKNLSAWEQVVLMLLHFICILKMMQIDVFLLQTTLTSPELLRNASSLAPQETTLHGARNRCGMGILIGKGGTKMSNHTKLSSSKPNLKKNFGWVQSGQTMQALKSQEAETKYMQGFTWCLKWCWIFDLRARSKNFETRPASAIILLELPG